MTEKLDFYDIFGSLVLGVLTVCAVPVLFPDVLRAGSPKYPDGFAVIALAALSLFVGQLIQTFGSTIEPLLYLTFSGSPSDQALDGKLPDRYLSKSEADRIRPKLLAAMGQADAPKSAIFRFAMQRSDAAGIGKASRFNALYAYHRGGVVFALVVALALLGSMCAGAAAQWSLSGKVCAALVAAGLLGISWYRAKQRGMYYAREVLLTAERVLDEKLLTTVKPAEPVPGKG